MTDPADDNRWPLQTVRGGRLLGLDIGSKRIGIAVSDDTGAIASPVGFVARSARSAADLQVLIDRYSAIRLIAGLPAGLSGREGPQAADTRACADALAEAVSLPLEYWDERLTTAIAERSLIASGAKRDKRKEQIDSVAAAVMLQGYLDAQKNRRRRGPI